MFLSARGGAWNSQRMRKRRPNWGRSQNLPVFDSGPKKTLRYNKLNKMP
jgi:hypothetical protein